MSALTALDLGDNAAAKQNSDLFRQSFPQDKLLPDVLFIGAEARLLLKEFDAAVKLSHRSTYSNGSNVALAWHIIKTKLGNELVWHNGATFGYSSFCGFIKEKKCAVVVLSNSSTNVDQIGISIFKILQK